jgi:predicted anti-sigma-YlaC factor YlaD
MDMNVTREVILDLVPLHLAGEASAASSALVEEYLRTDPELAARVRTMSAEEVAAPAAPATPERELQTLKRTRRLLFALRWLLAWGLALTLLPLGVEFHAEQGRIVEYHFLMRDFPVLGLPLLTGLACLTGYFLLRRRLRYTLR